MICDLCPLWLFWRGAGLLWAESWGLHVGLGAFWEKPSGGSGAFPLISVQGKSLWLWLWLWQCRGACWGTGWACRAAALLSPRFKGAKALVERSVCGQHPAPSTHTPARRAAEASSFPRRKREEPSEPPPLLS